ncbi:MAG TPA: NADH-quinone oxidoreductase subunit L, partial [Nitrospiraceae bacterium]|nr:NADH-quinone oxidoreductase subunit L [Nitrospiraceae bacterium]
MSLALAVPLLLLIASCLVVIGPDRTLHTRTKLAAYPVGTAFVCSIVILWLVATEGPITIRFYDLGSIASLAFPIGLYIDRLSAVMMTLIAGVSTVIYCYSTGYMYQDRHARRYLALICFTDFVVL